MDNAHVPSMDELLEGSKPSTVIKDAHKRVLLSYWKGVYPREYLLENKLMTESEYNSVEAYIPSQDPSIYKYYIFGMEIF